MNRMRIEKTHGDELEIMAAATFYKKEIVVNAELINNGGYSVSKYKPNILIEPLSEQQQYQQIHIYKHTYPHYSLMRFFPLSIINNQVKIKTKPSHNTINIRAQKFTQINSLVNHSIEITPEMQVLIQARKRPINNSLQISFNNLKQSNNELSCLNPGTWLNDGVINGYMELLNARNSLISRISQKKSKFFSSFFIDRLMRDGDYNNVERWTRNIGIPVLEMDKIFMPINISNTHWTLMVVYIQKKEIHYYDSMRGVGDKYMMRVLTKWISKQYLVEKKIFNINEWKMFNHLDIGYYPLQTNGFDCGMFVIMYADYMSDDLPLTSFSQNDMPFFRMKVGTDLIRTIMTY